jgi:hypothetical protein
MAINRTDEISPEQDEFAMTSTSITERPVQSSSTAVQSGWDAAEKLTVSAGDFPVEFKFNEGEFQVVKFIDQNGPFAIYKQHFLQQKTTGKRSYVSLGANDPLCVKLNSRPEDKRAFSIVNLSAAGGPQRQMLIASPRLYKSLHAAHFSPQGPLTKNYWAISRTGKMQQTVYSLNSVKGRDLLEDWSIDEAKVESVLATLEAYPRSAIYENSVAELTEIANDLA